MKILGMSGRALFCTGKAGQTRSHVVVEAWRYVKEMKPYIVPFIHKDPMIAKTLLRSYGLLILSKACFFGGPFLLKLGVNALGGSVMGGFNPLIYFFGFGACYSGSVVFQQMRNLQTLKLINAALIETTSRAYKHMLGLGPQFYFSGSQRHILFNLYKAQAAFEQNLKSFTQYFFPILIDVSFSVGLLLYYSNPLFALSFAGTLGAYVLFTVRYSNYRLKSIRLFRESEKRIDFVTSETFGNYYNVKYFQQQQKELLKYQQALRQYYEKNYQVQRTLGVLNSVQRFIFGSGLTFNMMLAAYYTQLGLLTTGDIMMIQSLMLQFLTPLFILGSMYRSFNDNLIDINKINAIMLTPASVQPGNKEIPSLRGEIQFKNVVFRYLTDSSNIVDDLSFKIEAGQFVAVVGRSGAGKTSILNLIFRLYDPREGKILLDGEDMRELNFGFRDNFAFVSQSPYLFNGTVMENLLFGSNKDSSKQQVIQLAKRFDLHQTIMQLPYQYETNVGEKGNMFSGGEKQRISLIRALMRKSKVLLLDEPTSSLDTVMEERVAEVLSELKGTTRVLITHREKILGYCDKVIRVGE